MKIKLDENLSRYLKPTLATEGHQASTAAVLFRPHSMGPKSVATFVLDFVHSCDLEELTGAVVVVDPDRVRVRRKPILE